MLVVNTNTLQAIDILDLVDQVFRQGLDTEHAKNIVRHGIPIHERIADPHIVAFLHRDMLAFRDQVFNRIIITFGWNNNDSALILIVLAKLHTSFILRDYGVIFRLARFKKLCNPRQATCDITGLS